MKKTLPLVMIALLVGTGVALAETATEKEVRDTIIKSFEHGNQHSKAMPDSLSKHGALQFWSSGGLMNVVPADDEGAAAAQSLAPKHIKVIALVEGQAAVAMYYSEGSLDPPNSEPVSHYMTRVTEVYVKEDGAWKVRAAHWSALAGGSGTSQTTLD